MFKIHVYWKNGRRVVKKDHFFSENGDVKYCLEKAFELYGQFDSVWVQPYSLD